MTAITNQTIAERASYDVGVYPQDVGTADVTGDYVSMESYNRVAAVAYSAEAADGTTFTVQLRQATDSGGSDAKDLGEAVTVTATEADEVLQAIAEERVWELDDDFTHVAVQLSSDEDGLSGAATLIRADGAYRP